MNIKLLEHFVAVYQHRNLTKTANSIGVTQSSISKSIQKLESHLGVLLFDRHTRDVTPTPAGQALYRDALHCISSLQTLVSHARFFSHGEKGTINVGCGPLIHELILKPLIGQIIARSADIQIHASTGRFADLIHGLDNHSYDCLLYDVGEQKTLHDPDNYEVIPLLQAPVYVVANRNHPIHQQTPVLEHLFNYKWVLPPIPQRYINHLPPQFQAFLLHSNKPDFEVTDLPQALELAEQNNLITIAVGDLTRDEWQQRSLTKITLPFSITSDIGLWRVRSRQLTPSLSEMMTMVKSLKV
ncbi:MAG: DNA-binding transcriptional LysR family regulator [Colwellia sp.]|jgi:DNA-binding transcriptional LysR family regulator